MARQHARHQRKTTVLRKPAVRGPKASSRGHHRITLEGKGQKPDTNVFPNAIEFLKIDVVDPFDAALEAEESELVFGGTEVV